MSHAASTDAGKIEDVLDSVVQQLRSPDSTKVATACAALAMLVAHNPSIVQNLSAKVLREVTRLLHVEHPLVQVAYLFYPHLLHQQSSAHSNIYASSCSKMLVR